MAVNIDWGLASTPNILGAYTGAREKAEQNALLRQQAEAQTQQRQVENQRADTRLTMDQAKATREQGTADAASWQKAAGTVVHLKQVLGTGGPEAAVAAFHQIAPGLGLSPEDTQAMGDALAKDPKSFLDNIGALAEQKLQFISTGNGGVAVGDQNTGQISQAIQPTYEQEYAVVPEGGKLIPKPRPGAPTAASAPPAPTTGAAPNTDDLFGALVQQESGGRPGVTGPETPYGRAQGKTQMLPATAEATAKKLGLPWHPELMTGTTPQAEDYQEKLGRAYFDEGLAKYNGDPHKALMYYHGGPDERLWGPKTQAYAQQVMARVEPYSVASNGATPPPPQSPPQAQPGDPAGTIYGAPKAAAVPSGYKANPDGSLAFIPGGPADPATKTSAGLKPVPSKIQGGYVDNAKGMTQIDQAIAAIKANPKALGATAGGYIRNKLGDDVSQRVDPGGVTTRAALANIGSLLIHDRSGAAVTAAETPRLLPFIPQVTDTPEAAVKKLQGLKEQYQNANSQIEVQFGEESGYRPIVGAKHSAAPPAATARTSAVEIRKAMTPAQRSQAGRFAGSKEPPGTQGNPLTPVSEAQYNNLRSGTYYIHSSGQVKVKP